LDPEPVFHTQRVSTDPVQVGSICLNSGDCRDIGGSNRNLLDFNDLHIDLEGRVYIGFADGCTGTCATGNNTTPENSRSRQGSVYYLESGPSLYESVEELAEFDSSSADVDDFGEISRILPVSFATFVVFRTRSTLKPFQPQIHKP
jgi:hypothetical protein